MSKANSLDNVNVQFKCIMEGMGIDEERQNKLATKLDLNKKIKTIISMQTLDERKKKISEYVNNLKSKNSLMSLISLSCSIENGNKSLFSIFMNEGGPSVLIKCMETMDNEFSYALCDFIYMILNKYDCEFPPFLGVLLKSFAIQKFDSFSFYKILNILVEKKQYHDLFKSVDSNRCVCNTYFTFIMHHIMGFDKIGHEITFVLSLLETDKAIHVKYILFVLDFHSISGKITNTELYQSIAKHIKPFINKGCKSNRIFEILRIAEKRNLLDVICCIVESFVLGDAQMFKELEDTIEFSKKSCIPEDIVCKTSQVTVQINNSDKITKKMENPNVVKDAEDPVSKICSSKPEEKKAKPKVFKKFTKKTKESKQVKNYVQIKWKKINKERTIFNDISMSEIERLFSEKDFDAFEKEKKAVNVVGKQSLEPVARTIFAEKKNYALNIALSRIRYTDKELKERILSLELNENDNLIKQLILYFPTQEELENLYASTKIEGRAESFFMECMKGSCKDKIDIRDFKTAHNIPAFKGSLGIKIVDETAQKNSKISDYKEIVKCGDPLQEINKFKESLYILNFKILLKNQSISIFLETFSEYYCKLLSSISLRSLLGVVLHIGNILNRNTHLGGAEAFSLEGLQEILETKKMIEIIRSKIRLGDFIKDFRILKEVYKISFENIKIDVNELTNNYKMIKLGKDDDLTIQYTSILDLFKKVNKLREECRSYLGEDINESFNNRMYRLYEYIKENNT